MKKILSIMLLIVISSMAMAQSTLQVKAVKEAARDSRGRVDSSIEVDYPVSSDKSLNARIRSFLVDIIVVNRGWVSDEVKPKMRVSDTQTFRNFIKTYASNIVREGQKEANNDTEENSYNHEMTVKMVAQGSKFVCYKKESSSVMTSMSQNFYELDYYVINKMTGEYTLQIFDEKYEDRVLSLMKKHSPKSRHKELFSEECDCETIYWLDTRFVHFVIRDYDFAQIYYQGLIPINEARPYLSSMVKAML